MNEFLQYAATFLMLTVLQAVLGFDNLLYISIESKRVEESRQSFVRKWGIGLAIVLRIVLLFVVTAAIKHFQNPFVNLDQPWLHFEFNVHSLIVLLGGGFVVYTAFKEIFHMISMEDLEAEAYEEKRSIGAAMFWIVTMNLVFSFDSILSAIALTAKKAEGGGTVITTAGMIVMSLAIIASGILMIVLADRVSEFLRKNRLYEVLGLFVLFLVGILLLSEGGHLAHIKLFGYAVEAMPKSTFYFVLAVLVVVDVVQGRYQRKLLLMRERAEARKNPA